MRKILLCFLFTFIAGSLMAQSVTMHTVRKGETLQDISQKYNVSVSDILAGNPDANSGVYEGMVLTIPVSANSGYAETPVENSYQTTTTQATISTDNVQTNHEGLVRSMDYTFMFSPDNKIYGLRINAGGPDPIPWLGFDFGFHYQFVKHGTYASYFGIGLSPKYVTSPLLLGLNLFPYVSLLGYDEVSGVNKNYQPTYKSKTKVSYGAILDLMAGLKLFTTKKGKDIFLTVSYEVQAGEFKTKGAFKNGLWGVGITVVGD